MFGLDLWHYAIGALVQLVGFVELHQKIYQVESFVILIMWEILGYPVGQLMCRGPAVFPNEVSFPATA